MKMQYEEIMWAEMKPDLYDGDNCDQVRPRWMVDVPKEGEEETDINLDPAHFPPGTKVVISVPRCPECHESCELCGCGFDWEAWRDDVYS